MWNPNLFNSPSYVKKEIENAYKAVVKYYEKSKASRLDFDEYYQQKYNVSVISIERIINPKPIRYNYKAPEGYCYVDSDYCTA